MAELPRAELPLPRGVLGDGPGKPHGFVTTLGWCGERVELIPAFRDLAWVPCGFLLGYGSPSPAAPALPEASPSDHACLLAPLKALG
jgi:hypothetical protein